MVPLEAVGEFEARTEQQGAEAIGAVDGGRAAVAKQKEEIS